MHNLPFLSIIVHSLILRIAYLASLHQSGPSRVGGRDAIDKIY